MIFEKNKHIILFANCIPVKGAERSIICDLQNNIFKYIPNDLYTILKRSNLSLYDFLLEYHESNRSVLEEYISFILENNFGFIGLAEDLENLPPLDLAFETSSQITNMILEFDENSDYLDKQLVGEIEGLGCKNIQLIFYSNIEIDRLKELLILFKSSIVNSIEIYLKYSSDYNKEILDKLSLNNMQITLLVIHSSPKELVLDLELLRVIHIVKNIVDFSHCGVVNHSYFNVNVEKFTEANNYNSCLHKKLSIDSKGNIKNCPALKNSFGNVKETKIEEILFNENEFKKHWNITKDQIETCKDCEFRYICTDCIAYKEDPEDDYSKPLKCGYNPYTNVWEEWSTNPLKQKAIEFYGMQELVKND